MNDNNQKVISFLNMKGGVGKTTLCLSLAYQLSVEFSKKILIVDMDPQFNATQAMMEQYDLVNEYLTNFRENKSVTKIFEGRKSIAYDKVEPNVSAEDLIISSEQNKNLDIVCGNIDLILQDRNQDTVSNKRLDLFIKKNQLREKYDFIFIDCPPTISFFTDAALIASDSFVIPVKIDKFSTLGVRMLNNVISIMKEDPDFNLNCIGIIYTIKEEQKKLESIRQGFEESNTVKNYFIFKNSMRKHNHLLSGSRGNIAYHYDDLRPEMNELAEEFLGIVLGRG